MRTTSLDYEKHAQWAAAVDGVADADRRVALLLRADDIESGKNVAGCPEMMRKKVAVYLRKVAKEYETEPCSLARKTCTRQAPFKVGDRVRWKPTGDLGTVTFAEHYAVTVQWDTGDRATYTFFRTEPIEFVEAGS